MNAVVLLHELVQGFQLGLVICQFSHEIPYSSSLHYICLGRFDAWFCYESDMFLAQLRPCSLEPLTTIRTRTLLGPFRERFGLFSWSEYISFRFPHFWVRTFKGKFYGTCDLLYYGLTQCFELRLFNLLRFQ